MKLRALGTDHHVQKCSSQEHFTGFEDSGRPPSRLGFTVFDVQDVGFRGYSP